MKLIQPENRKKFLEDLEESSKRYDGDAGCFSIKAIKTGSEKDVEIAKLHVVKQQCYQDFTRLVETLVVMYWPREEENVVATKKNIA